MLVNSSLFSELKLVSPQSIIQILGVLLIAMMGAAVTTLMPLLVGAYTDSGLFTDAQVGWLTSADIAGTLIASASAYFWSRKVNWRFVTIVSTIIFITANWLTFFITSFESLYVTRLLAGMGCGAAYAISLAALGDYKKSDMAFSAMVTIQVVFGTVGFWILPSLIGNYGLAGIFQFFNACLIPALIFCFITYPNNQKRQDCLGLNIDGNLKAALYVFLGVVAYYFAQGTVWAYLERIGVAVNLSGAEIGEVLGIGFAISALGSMLSGLYVRKWGRNSGLYLTAIIQVPCLVALYMMGENNAFWIYAISSIIYQVLWSFIIPIMMAIFNDIDKSGKLIVLCVSAFKAGLVIGPPVAGLVVTYFHVKEVLWLGGVAIIAGVWITVKANELINTDNEFV